MHDVVRQNPRNVLSARFSAKRGMQRVRHFRVVLIIWLSVQAGSACRASGQGLGQGLPGPRKPDVPLQGRAWFRGRRPGATGVRANFMLERLT